MDDLINKVHCLEFSDMCARLPDKSVDMILCDPPYAQTACAWDVLIPFDTLWTHFKRVIKPRGAIVLTASGMFAHELAVSNKAWYRYEWIIDKALPTNFLDVSWRPLGKHEVALVFYRKTPCYNPQMIKGSAYKKTSNSKSGSYLHGDVLAIDTTNNGTRHPTTIIYVNNANQVAKYHPTEKPVALFEYLIRTYTLEGQLVFDPTCGSGTTALASVRTGRNFICSDFTQEYVDIANARLERADPTKPTRLTDNHTQLSLLGLLND